MKFPFPTNPGEAGGNPAIGFLSPVPGAGATTLACLTALYLAESKKQVALVDFAPLGKIRTYMSLTVDVCPASILDAAGVRSSNEIRKAGVTHPRSLFIIPSATRPLDVQQVDSRLVSKTLSFLRKEFEITVAVLPPLYGAGWASAVICDMIYCVAKPDRVDLDYYRDNVELLTRIGCGERVKIILNQSRCPGGLQDEDIKNILQPNATFMYEPSIRAMCNKRYLDTARYKKQLQDMLEIEEGGVCSA